MCCLKVISSARCVVLKKFDYQNKILSSDSKKKEENISLDSLYFTIWDYLSSQLESRTIHIVYKIL